ncbi:MAG: NAD-dependent epimerase/dehydratase family protein [Streptosporangiaceae bacterium]|nr:NAD-dependent epimerase/dehydratase family protein [Streptosporangiaceae bacterium]MBV9857993.1 NAD-dependent epimerase/dehydratase family protein [Streptosporangiaceae bacterium]
MRILTIGGTRFIGARIVAALLGRGDEVTVVHRGSTEPPAGGGAAHIHADRADFRDIAARVRELRPDALIDTCAASRADADAVLPYLPDTQLVLLSSMDVYRAYELLLSDAGGQPVPLTEEAEVRRGRYPLRGSMDGHDDYDKLDVEPGYLARGGTVLRLAAIYGEHDPQRREEFILRRVRAGRKRIPMGPGTFLWTRGYVGDVARAVLAALDRPAAAAGQVFNIGDPVTDTVRDHAQRILGAAGHEAELVTVAERDLPADMRLTKSIAQHFLGDCGKAVRVLGWRPEDPAAAISRSVRWHLAHPPEDPDPDFSPDDRSLAEHDRALPEH